MRLAVDLDGVLADLHTPFLKVASTLFPALDAASLRAIEGAAPPSDEAGLPASAVGEAPSMSRRQTESVWREIAASTNFWETLDEIEPGAIAGLAAAAEAHHWDILFITSRPRTAGDPVQRQSQRWLERHGFSLPSLMVVHGNRGRIAEALAIDVVIDDRPENCLDVVLESNAGGLLMWRSRTEPPPDNAKQMGIATVHTMAEALDAIRQAERASAGPGGVVDRLRSLFGLAPRSASPLVRKSRR